MIMCDQMSFNAMNDAGYDCKPLNCLEIKVAYLHFEAIGKVKQRLWPKDNYLSISLKSADNSGYHDLSRHAFSRVTKIYFVYTRLNPATLCSLSTRCDLQK